MMLSCAVARLDYAGRIQPLYTLRQRKSLQQRGGHLLELPLG